MKFFNAISIALIILATFVTSCDTGQSRFSDAYVRYYFSPDANACGWVIEVFDPAINALIIYRPVNMDPEYEVDGLPVLVDYNFTGGTTTCSFYSLLYDIEEIFLISIK